MLFFRSRTCAFGFITLVCSVFIYEAAHFEPHDFSNYYFAADFLTNGTFDSSIYFPHQFNLDIAQLGQEHIYTSYAPHNPFLALFFSPLTLFSLGTAKLIFNILGLGLFLFSLNNLTKMYGIKPLYLVLIPILFFVPLRNNFLFGQMYLLLFFLLVEGFLAFKKERYVRMALFWGIAVLLKVIPIILFGMLLFKKKYRAILYFGLGCLALFLLSVWVSGIPVWEFYFKSVLPKSSNGEITTEFVQNYQSVFMLLKGYLIGDDAVFKTILFSFKLLILGLAFFITRKENDLFRIFSFWIMASILLSPYGSTYTSILLLIPFVFMVKSEPNFNWKLGAVLILFGLISNLPIQHFSSLALPFSFPRLLLMIILLIVLIGVMVKRSELRWIVVGIIPLCVGYFFIQPNFKNVDKPLIADAPLLTYDFKAENGYLVYTAWSPAGAEEHLTEIKVNSLDSTAIRVEKGQFFKGDKQLTFDQSHKIKPYVLNDSALIYLSDYKRGIGFFQIRTLSLPVNEMP